MSQHNTALFRGICGTRGITGHFATDEFAPNWIRAGAIAAFVDPWLNQGTRGAIFSFLMLERR
jgi:hypothetical protein